MKRANEQLKLSFFDSKCANENQLEVEGIVGQLILIEEVLLRFFSVSYSKRDWRKILIERRNWRRKVKVAISGNFWICMSCKIYIPT